MWYSAGVRPDSTSAASVAKLNAYISHNYSSSSDNFIQKYLLMVKQILLAKRGNIELICIYDLLNAELEILNKQCDDLLEIFVSALRDVSEYTRVLVARSVGILWAIGSTLEQFSGYVRKSSFYIKNLLCVGLKIIRNETIICKIFADQRNAELIITTSNRASPWVIIGFIACYTP